MRLISYFFRLLLLSIILLVETGCSLLTDTPVSQGNGTLSNAVNGVYVSGSSIYAATGSGLYISPDNGSSWVIYNNSTTPTFDSTTVYGVSVNGANIYAATAIG